MAKEIEDGLKKHGVKPELCKVGVCTAEERTILEEARDNLFTKFTGVLRDMKPSHVSPGDAKKCHGCGMSHDCFFQPLKRCARCEKAFYYSKECQKKHWKQHKAVCPAPGATPSLSAYDYFNKKAPTDTRGSRSVELSPPFPWWRNSVRHPPPPPTLR